MTIRQICQHRVRTTELIPPRVHLRYSSRRLSSRSSAHELAGGFSGMAESAPKCTGSTPRSDQLLCRIARKLTTAAGSRLTLCRNSRKCTCLRFRQPHARELLISAPATPRRRVSHTATPCRRVSLRHRLRHAPQAGQPPGHITGTSHTSMITTSAVSGRPSRQ